MPHTLDQGFLPSVLKNQSPKNSTAQQNTTRDTMHLLINGQTENPDITDDPSVAGLVRTLGYSGDYFAVALNRTVVLRSDYATTMLSEGDCVEILTPMQGG